METEVKSEPTLESISEFSTASRQEQITLLANALPRLSGPANELAKLALSNLLNGLPGGYEGTAQLLAARAARGEDNIDPHEISGQNIAFEAILKASRLNKVVSTSQERVAGPRPIDTLVSRPSPPQVSNGTISWSPAKSGLPHEIKLPNLLQKLSDAGPRAKVTLRSKDLEIRVKSRAGSPSRYGSNSPSVYFVDTFGERYIGRIEPHGYVPKAYYATLPVACREELTDLLGRADKNFKDAIVTSARIGGKCAMCNRPLDDERSVKAGYGPVCVKNYGLPWGEK